MRDEDLNRVFHDLLGTGHSIENTYTKYADLAGQKFNRNNPEGSTHVVTWINKHGLSGRTDKITRLIIAALPRGSAARSKPFSFKTYHALTGNELEELESSIYRGSAIENLSGFMAGILIWLFFLSIPLVPVVGTSFLLLTVIGFLGFWASIYSLSSARYRYLPNEFREISADFWAIHSLAETEPGVGQPEQ